MHAQFTAPMWHWRGPAPYHFISLPVELADEIKARARELTYGWGMIPVAATIGTTRFTTSMYEKDGTYILPIKNAVRFAEELEIGALIVVDIDLGHT